MLIDGRVSKVHEEVGCVLLTTDAARRDVRRAPLAWLGLLTIACLGMALPGQAAELQLRRECGAGGPMVTLGDVAEILTGDAAQREELATVELFPAPPAGSKRFVRAREIQDMLLIRGINLAEHRFSGASQVTVVGAGQAGQEKSPTLPGALAKQAERQVNEAIVRYLKEYVSATDSWSVAARLDERQARLVAAAERIAVRGGSPPWQGMQRFELTIDSPTGAARLAVLAEVATTPAVVVAARALNRGELVTAADVQLVPGSKADAAVFHAIEEVVGKEASQVIPAGKVIDRDALRAPLVVRRGEVVTVYVRSAGIRVRTVGRAKEDGSLGDLVTVESMENRKSFFARVCGIQEVEIYARAVQSSSAAGAEWADRPARPGLVKPEPVAAQAEPIGESPVRQVSNTSVQLRVIP